MSVMPRIRLNPRLCSMTGCAACETVIRRTSCEQMHLSKIFRRLMKKVTECGRLSARPKSSEYNGK